MTEINTVKGSKPRFSPLVFILGIWIISTSAAAQQASDQIPSNSNLEANQKKLDEIESALEALEAQKEKLLKEREQIQISMWGSAPEEDDVGYTES